MTARREKLSGKRRIIKGKNVLTTLEGSNSNRQRNYIKKAQPTQMSQYERSNVILYFHRSIRE